jgi:large subunit ribosomal protein L18
VAQLTKLERRLRRHKRVRKHIMGTLERPRLGVYRSNTGIYAQVIDDFAGRVLVSASSLDSSVENGPKKKPTEIAREVGLLLGKRAKEKGVDKVVFDRGGFLYHGRVKALAEGAREAGLEL